MAQSVNDKAAAGIEAVYGSPKNPKIPQTVQLTKSDGDDEKQKEQGGIQISTANLYEDESKESTNFYQKKSSLQQALEDHTECDPKVEFIELPRDVLTAYILIHLENDGANSLWDQFSCLGKMGILLSVLTPFAIQWFVAVTLIIGIEWTDADKITDVQGVDIWYNVISLAILFIYMFRDLGAYILVWYATDKIEKQQHIEYNPFHKSRLKRFVDVRRWDYHALDPREIDIRKHKQRILFLQFRILILGVFVLYLMLTFYSLVQIALTEDLAEKLEVSLAIFFLLEVDDWSYELFFAQNGLLKDDQFNLEFELPNIDLEIQERDKVENTFTINTLLTNRIGNIRKEIYVRNNDKFDELTNKLCIVMMHDGKKVAVSRTVEEYEFKHYDTITWYIDDRLKAKSMDLAEEIDLKDDENEKNLLFDARTRKLWCSLWFVYGSLVFVLIYSFLYQPDTS